MKSKNGKQLLLSVYNHCFQMSLLCLLLLVSMAPFLLKKMHFLHCWGGGIKGRDFTGLVFSLKGNSHNIPALAISKDPPNGMRMDLAFLCRTEKICYSKCQLVYSRKLQRFQTQYPSLNSNTHGLQFYKFYSCASCMLLSALLQHVTPQ